MMDNGDGTWSVTVEMEPAYTFKVINSNDWDGTKNKWKALVAIEEVTVWPRLTRTTARSLL